MNILALQPYADGAGHYGRYAARICQDIGALGHRVVLCSNNFAARAYLAEPAAFEVVSLGRKHSFFKYERIRRSLPVIWLLGRIKTNLATLRAGWRLARREAFDVVHLLSYELISTWAFLSFLRPRGPVVMEIAAPTFSPEKYYGSPLEKLWRRLQTIALRRLVRSSVRGLNVYSETHSNELRRQLDLPESFPIQVTGDSRRPTSRTPDRDSARRRIGLGQYEGCVFLFFGTLRRDKGPETLMAAMALINRDCRLVVAGMPLDWSPRERASDGRVVTRLSYVPDDEVEWYFAASDALLLPYASFYAGSSGPLFDACAHGIPVIASEVSEMGRVVRQHRLGLTVLPDDPQRLAAAMEEFLGLDSTLKDEFRKNALDLIARTDTETVAQNFLRLYERVTSEALT